MWVKVFGDVNMHRVIRQEPCGNVGEVKLYLYTLDSNRRVFSTEVECIEFD